MVITCEKCGSRYKIKPELAAGGPKRAKCKKCGGVIIISAPGKPLDTPVEVKKSSPAGIETPSKPDAVPTQTDSETQAEQPASADSTETGKTPSDKVDTAAEQMESRVQPEQEKVTEEETADTVTAEGQPEKVKEASGEQLSATEEESAQAKLEKRRREMEDEISGRLNKAALETLDFDILSELAKNIKEIGENTEYKPEKETQLFVCIHCKTIYALFPDDSRVCANCPGDISLIRGEDITRQFGMFG